MYYKKLEINHFEEIQKVITPYFINFASNDITENKPFYNYSSEDQLKKIKNDLPIFFDIIKQELNAEILNLSYLYYDNTRYDIPIHTDVKNLEVKKRVKLNWPVLNCNYAETIFYSLKENAIPMIGSAFNEHLIDKTISYTHYSKKDCIEVDNYILDKPTLMDVRQPHGVKFINNTFPRILISMRLSNEDEIIKKFFAGHKYSTGL